MKFEKEIDGQKVVVEVEQEFLFSLYEREGYTKVDETKKK